MVAQPPGMSAEVQPERQPGRLDVFLFPCDTPFVVLFGLYVEVSNRSWISIEPPPAFDRVPINLVSYDDFQMDLQPMFEPGYRQKSYNVISAETMAIEKRRQYKNYCARETKLEGLIFKGLLDVPLEGAELQIPFRGQRRHLRRLELYYGRRLGETLAQDKLDVQLAV